MKRRLLSAAIFLYAVSAFASAADHSIPIQFGDPTAILPTQGAIRVEWGIAAVTENSTIKTCVGTCTVTLRLAAGTYLWRHTWLTAAGVTLGRGQASPLTVDDSGPAEVAPYLLLENGSALLREGTGKFVLEAGHQ